MFFRLHCIVYCRSTLHGPQITYSKKLVGRCRCCLLFPPFLCLYALLVAVSIVQLAVVLQYLWQWAQVTLLAQAAITSHTVSSTEPCFPGYIYSSVRISDSSKWLASRLQVDTSQRTCCNDQCEWTPMLLYPSTYYTYALMYDHGT